MKRIAFAVLAVSLWGSVIHAATYAIDPMHSSVAFSIRHLVGKVRGHFDTYEGTFDYDKKSLKSLTAQSTIQAASINTGIEKRDNHLRSPDFFDVQKFPTLAFKSSSGSDVKEATAKLKGDLTIHGVTKPVVLDIEFGGIAKDPWGNERAGLTAKTRINRKDFGLTWNQALEAGGFLVGDDVDIELNIEGIAKK
jgi:polyisoprenoid-binding protein YceI